MLSLTAIRSINLRSISDSTFIELKPITILVGRNSSGKSTFARLLPLLRQSAEAVTRSPLLWFGRFVDFGTISDAVNINSERREVEFGYRFKSTDSDYLDIYPMIDEDFHLSIRHYYGTAIPSIKTSALSNVDIFVSLAPTQADKAKVQSVRVELFGTIITYEFSNKNTLKLTIDGIEVAIGERYRITWNEGLLIPNISIYKTVEPSSRADPFSYRIDFLHERFLDFIQEKLVHGRTMRGTVASIARQIPICPPEELRERIKKIKAIKSWKNAADRLLRDEALFDEFKNSLYLAAAPSILRMANQALSSYVLNVKYLEPLRATAERFYRRQDLAIDEIDSRGENIAMFLDSLSAREREDFGAWCKSELGFNISAMPEGGHVSIKLKHREEERWTNLADMGFGFSQVLPIAIQLWSSSHRGKKRSNRDNKIDRRQCLVVEQPELHLHPAFQGRLADLFVRSLNLNEDGAGLTHLVIETHSPHLIYRLGELVEKKLIDRDSVQIILFEKSENRGVSTVSTAGFNERGVLQNWPSGFFELDPEC